MFSILNYFLANSEAHNQPCILDLICAFENSLCDHLNRIECAIRFYFDCLLMERFFFCTFKAYSLALGLDASYVCS